MKTGRIFLSLMALGSFLLASCGEKGKQASDKGEAKKEEATGGDKKAQEKAAIEAFAKQIADLGIVEDINAFEELEANAEENPVPLFEALDVLAEKFGEVNTDGLPADLEEGFEAMKSGFSDLAEHCRAMPMPREVLKGGEAAITAWVTEKVTADPAFLAKFEEEMGAWEKKVEELGSKLEEMDGSVFEKYGIELPSGEEATSGGGEAQDKSATEAFAKQIADLGIVEDINAFEELEANAEENPVPLFEALDVLAEKFGEVNTDGLPADLEEGFEAMKSGFSDLAEHCRAMPMPREVLKGGEAAITAWVTEKVTADPAFLAKFEEEMGAWEKKVEELGSKLEEMDGSVFEKYDIELE